MRRAVRAVFRRWARSVLVIGVLCFIFALLFSIPPSIVASRETTQQTIDVLIANAKEVNATVGVVATQINCRLPEVTVPVLDSDNETMVMQVVKPLMNTTQYANNISSIPHVKALFALYETEVNVSGFVFDVCGLPVDDSSLFVTGSLLLPSNVTLGRNLAVDDVGVVVLHERVADYFDVDVGGTVKILGKSFRVVGVEGYTALNRTVVYVGLDDVWMVTNNTGNATSVRVFVDDVANVEEVANCLSVDFSELSISFSAGLVYSVLQMQSATNAQLELVQATMQEIERMGVLELGVVVVVACLLVLFVMLYTVRERTREVGTLRALGASGFGVLGQFMFEGVLLSFVAGLLGVVVGGVGTPFFAGLLLPDPVVVDGVLFGGFLAGLSFEFVLFSFGVAVLLGVLGSLYPAWRASRIRPAEAMRYD
ncbi:MAG: FtsX-like permease family protein [Nitrososphaerota archaeon]|nr:FtsX-like permease family protein [Nitrososphaerota archaeon]